MVQIIWNKNILPQIANGGNARELMEIGARMEAEVSAAAAAVAASANDVSD